MLTLFLCLKERSNGKSNALMLLKYILKRIMRL
jgi:hypothetical protein